MLIYEIVHKKSPFTYGEFIGGNIVENWLTDKNSEF